jgi:hypothetical protein
MFSDCSGECCICACGDFCLAGHGDDDYSLASKEQINKRLNKGQYSSYKKTMLETLENVYGYKYEEPIKKKYILHINMELSKEPNGDILWEVIKDALLSYTKQTKTELFVSEAVLEEDK